MSAYLESDSMMPEHRRPRRVEQPWTWGELILRLAELEKRVKELEHRQPV